MSSAAQPKLIWRLVEESLSDAGFLWTRLDQALDSSRYTLPDVDRWVERRLFGALDGVGLAGLDALSPLLAEALTDQDLGLVSTAAYVLGTMGGAAALKALEDSLRQVPDERVSAFARGLGRTGNTELLHSLWSRVQGAPSACRAVVLEALVFCGAAPDTALKELVTAEHAGLRRAATSALAFLPASQRADVMWLALRSPDPEVRSRGNIAGLIAGDSAAWARCREAVRARSADSAYSAEMLTVAMLGSASDHDQLVRTLAVPDSTRDALWALSFAGTCDAVDALLVEAAKGQHVVLACKAVSAITGVELSQLPASTAAGASTDEETQDEHVPDAAALERWWQRERKRFEPEACYQGGKLKTLATLREGLRSGTTARRHAIAMELAIRTGGKCRVQALGFCEQQRRQMAQLDTLDSRQLRESASALGIAPVAEA